MSDESRTTLLALEVIAKRNGDTMYTGYEDLLRPNQYYTHIQIPSHMLLPGCRVEVHCPNCPQCGKPEVAATSGRCSCGHNWIAWADLKYQHIKMHTDEPTNAAG